MSIYYINLKKSTNRNNNIIQQFNKHNYKDYHRIEAVLGKNIKSNQGIYNYDNHLLHYNIHERHNLSNNEIATVLSHYFAIKKAYLNNKKLAIFAEDDIILDKINDLKKEINDIINNAPKDFQIIKVGSNNPAICEKLLIRYRNNKLYANRLKIHHNWGAFFYIMNRKGMEWFINKFEINSVFTIDKNCPFAVADYIIFTNPKTYTYTKPIIYCDETSTLIHKNVKNKQIQAMNIIKNYKL